SHRGAQQASGQIPETIRRARNLRECLLDALRAIREEALPWFELTHMRAGARRARATPSRSDIRQLLAARFVSTSPVIVAMRVSPNPCRLQTASRARPTATCLIVVAVYAVSSTCNSPLRRRLATVVASPPAEKRFRRTPHHRLA